MSLRSLLCRFLGHRYPFLWTLDELTDTFIEVTRQCSRYPSVQWSAFPLRIWSSSPWVPFALVPDLLARKYAEPPVGIAATDRAAPPATRPDSTPRSDATYSAIVANELASVRRTGASS